MNPQVGVLTMSQTAFIEVRLFASLDVQFRYILKIPTKSRMRSHQNVVRVSSLI